MPKKLWGGRFKKDIHPLMKCFSYSLATDGELLGVELRVNEAWVKMLARMKLISTPEKKRLLRGLDKIRKAFPYDPHKPLKGPYEDIHTFIQQQLEKRVGPVGKKLHTARSRNDLVVTSTRMYLREQTAHILQKTKACQKALVACARKSPDQVAAGLTHLRKAQPVLISHHLLAYVEMFEEDRARLEQARDRMDVLALGSAALGGSSLPLDQKYLAKQLGFTKIAANSMAAVSDRAFITELLAALSILWMHLSRLSEDFILWNSEAFGFVELDDEFATGSSLMPQKKNPDLFELLRGRSATIFGHLQAALTMQKGLPLTYNRDMQEDKPGVFDAVHKTSLALELLALSLPTVKFDKAAMRNSVKDHNLYATDVLEYLVGKGVAFSEAHATVGRAVALAEVRKKSLGEISLMDWKKLSKYIEKDVYGIFSPARSVRAKKTIGSTNPSRVRREIARWSKRLR